jgi:hypothetical protein
MLKKRLNVGISWPLLAKRKAMTHRSTLNQVVTRIMETHRKRHILEVLQAATQYQCNHQTMADILAAIGHPVALERLQTDLQWLQEQGFIELRQEEDLLVCRLRQAGADQLLKPLVAK